MINISNLCASPLWDADDNLIFRIFEHGKGDTPLGLMYDYDFAEMINRFSDDLEIAKKLSKSRLKTNLASQQRELDEIPIKVPAITGAEKSPSTIVMRWVNEGDEITKDRPLFEIETDKATTEIVAEESGTISRILRKAGDTVYSGDIVLKFLR